MTASALQRAATSRLPSKLFFRIGEVASLVGVEPHVLRYWEREFRSIRPTKSAKGQRVYSRKDVENLLRVRDLLYRDGFTIAGAKKRLLQPSAPSTDGGETPSHPPGHPAVEDELEPTTAAAEAPLSGPISAPVSLAPSSTSTREALLALRLEVEGFLAELEPPPVMEELVEPPALVPAPRHAPARRRVAASETGETS